ncbi:MAG: hypothetical protein ACXVRS_09280 [Gaiellaceae bacterium]
MHPIHTPASGSSVVDIDGGRLSLAALFAIVWDALAEVLGTAAAAAIVRRATGRAAATHPQLIALVVTRENLEYRYTLPPAWSQPAAPELIELRTLALEIGRLLRELTGIVVIRRLEQIPELQAAGLVWQTESAN